MTNYPVLFAHCANVQKYEQCKIGLHFFICGAYNAAEHYGKRIKLLWGCPFEGWLNRTWPIQPISQFLPKSVGWPCPVRSALKRTPLQDFNYFSIVLYYIISTTYQKIGDLFCPVIFLDFRTVWPTFSVTVLWFIDSCYQDFNIDVGKGLSNYTNILTAEALKYIYKRQESAKNEPFFLYWAPDATHGPTYASSVGLKIRKYFFLALILTF